MREGKSGKLHSGSKKGPIVKKKSQMLAIALSEAGIIKKKKGKNDLHNKHTIAFRDFRWNTSKDSAKL